MVIGESVVYSFSSLSHFQQAGCSAQLPSFRREVVFPVQTKVQNQDAHKKKTSSPKKGKHRVPKIRPRQNQITHHQHRRSVQTLSRLGFAAHPQGLEGHGGVVLQNLGTCVSVRDVLKVFLGWVKNRKTTVLVV